MKPRTIKALLKKDMALFIGNRFYLFITILGLVVYALVYFIMPSELEERLSLAMYAPVLPPAFEQLAVGGIDVEYFESEDSLRDSVISGEFDVGVVLPPDIMDIWAEGGKPGITVFYASTAAPEITETTTLLIKELSYLQTGQALHFDAKTEILGPDLLGEQITLRDRMRPMLVILILLTEIMTLAGLIAAEIQKGTARALLVTPMRTSDLFLAKGILGVGMAMAQAALFMAIVGGFGYQPLIILTTLFVGSIFVVGTGFLIASIVRDVNAVTGWGLLVLILFAIPGIGAVIPGLLAEWAKVIPSYYLVDTINKVANYGAGWAGIASNLGIMSGITLIIVIGGLLALRRRFQ